ncbi:hypothetical protein GCM10023100_39950 [Actinocorallia cavernae]|uniref:Uncharacterized protein n=2 Tax=Actinomycetes TaxID=1760 RepID=A0ABN3MBC3_9ACTN
MRSAHDPTGELKQPLVGKEPLLKLVGLDTEDTGNLTYQFAAPGRAVRRDPISSHLETSG